MDRRHDAFTVETNYCLTLDHILNMRDPVRRSEMLNEILSNSGQHTEWVQLFSLEDIIPSMDSIDIGALESCPFLVLDTRHFSRSFFDRLEKYFHENATNIDGLLIHGDNLDALKQLQQDCKGQIQCAYIDPPYNTGCTAFDYKDNFDSDQWRSMMQERIEIAAQMLRPGAVFCSSIDDSELASLFNLLDTEFHRENFLANLIWNRNHSAQAGIFKRYHEYIICYTNSMKDLKIRKRSSGIIEAGAMKKLSRRHKLQAFTFPAGTKWEAPDGKELLERWGGIEQVELVSGKMICRDGTLAQEVTLRAAWTQMNQMRTFFDGEPVTDTKGQRLIEFYFNASGKLKYRKERAFETPPTVQKFGTAGQATKFLFNILGFHMKSTPKPLSMMTFLLDYFLTSDQTVIDYFAGSGTTAHAIIELNREDHGTRKYILVESSDLFNAVLLPRLKKAVYSKEWKNGKPVSRDGVSHCFKYMKYDYGSLK